MKSIPDIHKHSLVRSYDVINKGYVFLSFYDSDSIFTSELRDFLKSQELAYWDFEEGERNYQIQFFIELENAINGATAVLSVVSPDWKKSKRSVREFIYSEEIGKPVFLLKYEKQTLFLPLPDYLS